MGSPQHQLNHVSGEVEITPRRCNKGSFMSRVLRMATKEHGGMPPDFVFVIGDDASDERMFKSALGFIAGQAPKLQPSGSFMSRAKEWMDSGEEGATGQMPLTGSPETDAENPLTAAFMASLDAPPPPLSPLACTEPGMMDTKVFTCTVGKKASVASFYVEDVRSVENTLGVLTENL